MTKLSANRAAKEAGVAKKTLLEALTSGRMSAGKNDKGHWEIDPAELFRVFPKTSGAGESGTVPHPPKKTSENNDLLIEVATLREQLKSAEKEKDYLSEKIEDLKARAERAEDKEDELRRLLPAPPPRQSETPSRRFFGLLKG